MNIHDPNEPFDDELVSAYLDDELTPEERAQVERRLASDPAARKLLDELRAISQAVGHLPTESLGENLRATIISRAERVQQTKSSAAGSSQALRRADEPRKKTRWTIGRTRRGWIWAGMAIAAALLIMVIRPDEPEQNSVPELIAARSERTEEAPSTGFGIHGDASGGAAATARPDSGTASRFYMEGLNRSSSPADQPNPLLVVYVCARPEAIRDRTIDNVLVSNQIHLEDEQLNEADGAAVATSKLELRELKDTSNLARAYRVPQQQTFAAAERLTGQLRSRARRSESETVGDTFAHRPEASLESRETDEESIPNDVDVVLVEAPVSQIAGCLSGIQADLYNFRCVEVKEPVEVDNKPASDSTVNWQQYNRGRAIDESRLADTFGALQVDALKQQTALGGALVEMDSRASGRGGVTTESASGRPATIPPSKDEQQIAPGDAAQLARTKEAVDELLEQTLPVVASRKLKLAKNAMQVLFVLSADPPDAEQATPTEPAQPSSPAASEVDNGVLDELPSR